MNNQCKKQMNKEDPFIKWSRSRANESVPIENIDELFETFTLFDKNYNGAINKEELSNIMKSISLNATVNEIEEMMDEVDTDKNDYLDFPEFLAFLSRRVESDDSTHYKELFGKFYLCAYILKV